MLTDLATVATDQLLAWYESIRTNPGPIRKALMAEIERRVQKARGTPHPVIHGEIQYKLDVNGDLCRVRVRATWAREIRESRTGEHERRRKEIERGRVRDRRVANQGAA